MKVSFSPDYSSPQLEVADGAYRRIFRLTEGPFDLSEAEWARVRRLVGGVLLAEGTPESPTDAAAESDQPGEDAPKPTRKARK